MIQVPKFAISKKQFAAHPSTFCVSHFLDRSPAVPAGDVGWDQLGGVAG